MFFIIISAVHVSSGVFRLSSGAYETVLSCFPSVYRWCGWVGIVPLFFRPSSGAYETVCAALGIVMLSCCLPLVF